MVTRSELESFWRSWSYAEDPALEFAKLRNRVYEITSEFLWTPLGRQPEFFREFCHVLGLQMPANIHESKFFLTILARQIEDAKTLLRLVEVIQAAIWAVRKAQPSALEKFVPRLSETFQLTPTVLIDVVSTADGPILLRSGAKLMDAALVQENLMWLADYPAALKPFREALAIYLHKDVNKYRNLLDNLRFAVEQLLRAVLSNEKSLEHQKEELLKWLAGHHFHQGVISLYQQLLFGGFSFYQNDAVKHAEKYTPTELEFMIYLTGTFTRLILQTARAKTAT